MDFVITSVLSLLAALPELVKLIKELMGAAQTEYVANSGPDKKQAVLSGIAAVTTDPTVWDKVKGIISAYIDFLAKFKPKNSCPPVS
jgi:hypothetical protein